MLRGTSAGHRIAPAGPNNSHIRRVRCRPQSPVVLEMLRTYLLAAALLFVAVPADSAEQPKTSSWTSEKMRLKARPMPVLPADELAGNCPGLTVTIKTRIEQLKALQEKVKQEQWPPPSLTAQWAKRPLGGDIVRQQEHIARLNAALRVKGCQTVNVDEELRRAPSAVPKSK